MGLSLSLPPSWLMHWHRSMFRPGKTWTRFLLLFLFAHMWEEGRRGKEAGWPTQCCHSSFSMDPYQETNIIRYLCNMIASSYGALAIRFFSCFIILKGHYSCFFIWSGKRTFRLLSLRFPYLHCDGKKTHPSCTFHVLPLSPLIRRPPSHYSKRKSCASLFAWSISCSLKP